MSREFFWRHLFKAITAVVIAILTFWGNEKIKDLQEQAKILQKRAEDQAERLMHLRCVVSAEQTDQLLTKVIDDMGKWSMDDVSTIDLDKFPFAEFGRIQKKDFYPNLVTCPEGELVRARLSHYNDGIRKYIVRSYAEAATEFNAIEPVVSISESMLGAAPLPAGGEPF